MLLPGDGENANVEIGSYDDMPPNAKDAYDKYEQTGWKGNVPGQAKGTHAGGTWKNENAQLPCTDSNGNTITYREFDVNSAGPNGRDAERFVVGSDGSVWYTDSHYGDNPSKNGIADFIKIK